VSLPRVAFNSRSATVRSSVSPAAWPNESFTFLKSSRSTYTTPMFDGERSAVTSACSMRSSSRARFARPVSGSWNAWWLSRVSSSRRSVTS